MLKKLVLFVAAVMLLASSAQAALNEVKVATLTPPIVTGMTGEAGKISFVIDAGTKWSKGDTFSGQVSEGAVLAKDVDFYVIAHQAVATSDTNGSLFGNDVLPTDLVIHVYGKASSRNFALKVVNGTLTAHADAGKSTTLTLFDGQNGTNLNIKAKLRKNVPGGYFNATAGNFRDAQGAVVNTVNLPTILPSENTLCVTVSPDFKYQYVHVALEHSVIIANNLNFNPSSPTIAEVMPATVTPVELKRASTFKLGDGQSGCSVNYESGAFCEGAWKDPYGYVALNSGAGFPGGMYTVTAEILVDGAVGAKGAYFASHIEGMEFVDDRGDLSKAFPAVAANKVALAKFKHFLADGAEAAATPSCSPKDNAKIVRVVSMGAVDALLAKKNFLRFDMPTIYLVESELPKGAKIGVKITVEKGCGKFVAAEFKELFAVVDECSGTAKPKGKGLLFPYFADAPFWNGMALTNTDSAPVNATLTIVDAKGGEGTISVTVPAKGMYVSLVEAIIADSAFNGKVNPKERCYIMVAPQSGSLTGFAMMGNAGESMGYTVNN